MAAKSPIKLNKEKELAHILSKAQKALQLLIEADYNAVELMNRDLLDYKQGSAMTKYFLRALAPLRELIEYLENFDRPDLTIDRSQMAAAIAETYQKYFIDREVSAGVPFILYDKETGRVFGQPSVLPLRDSDLFITKLTENCFGDNVSSAADIEYFLTKVSPDWLEDLINNSDIKGR
ncbi:MAG: hypothetical protein WCY37_05500 [Candidatus Dojkabacteria bacterium]